jgi:Flp pilus assembly protein TadD
MPIAQGFASWQLPGALLLVGVIGLCFATARRAPVVSFGIAWLAITLLPSSNLILPSGILLAERTLFTPSIGAMLAVCAALQPMAKHLHSSVSRLAVVAGVQTLLVAGIARSIIQTAVWRDNETLFRSAVMARPMTYRAHYMLAAWLMTRKNYAMGEREYLRAMELFPDDPFVAYNLGQEYFGAGLYDPAYRMYARAEEIMPGFQDVEARMALTRAVQGRFSEARELAARALRRGVGDVGTLRSILSAAALDERSRRRLAAAPAVVAR